MIRMKKKFHCTCLIFVIHSQCGKISVKNMITTNWISLHYDYGTAVGCIVSNQFYENSFIIHRPGHYNEFQLCCHYVEK
jgi:hypothetical protein